MALTDAEIAAVLRLKEEQERILNQHAGTIAAAQKAAAQRRDYIDPPALRHMREQHEQSWLSRIRRVLADTFAGPGACSPPAAPRRDNPGTRDQSDGSLHS